MFDKHSFFCYYIYGDDRMKKTAVILLILTLLAALYIPVFSDYREPVDGINMHPGLNPVVRLHDGGRFDYVVYARDMKGMTNGDFIVTYDASAVRFVSFEETGNHDLLSHHEENGCLYISFLYNESNPVDTVKMFVLTFETDGNAAYPKLKVDNIAGTFIRSVQEIVVVDETGTNSPSESNTNSGDAIMRGDVDESGKITAADARLALRISAQLETVSERKMKAADVNGDGKVTSADARLILRFSAGLQNFI